MHVSWLSTSSSCISVFRRHRTQQLFIFLRCCMGFPKAIFRARDGQRAMGCTGSQDAKGPQPSAGRSGAVVYHAPELPKVPVVARPPNRDSHERHVKERSLGMFLETGPGCEPSQTLAGQPSSNESFQSLREANCSTYSAARHRLVRGFSFQTDLDALVQELNKYLAIVAEYPEDFQQHVETRRDNF